MDTHNLWTRPAWHADASCRDLPVDMFFPESGAGLEPKTICRTCPVVEPCRTYARTAGERFGIWGAEGYRSRRIAIRDANRTADLQRFTVNPDGTEVDAGLEHEVA